MAATTLTDIDHALKTLYPKGPAYELMTKSPLLAFLKKDTSFVGRNAVIDVISALGQGRSASIAKALANQNPAGGDAFTITRAKNYAVFSLDRETMKAADGDKGSLVDALALETKGALLAFEQDLSNDLYGDGSGRRGRVASISTNTITLVEPNDVVRFERGMRVEFSATATGGAVESGNLTISKVDRDSGVITFTANVTTGIATAAANDYIYAEGDYDAKCKGISAWIPASAPSATTFFGVDRSKDPTRLAGIRYDAKTLGYNHEEALIKGLARGGRDGAYPKHIFLHTDDMAALELVLGTRKVFEDVESEAGIGFSGLVVRGPKGKVRCYEDPWAIKGTALALDMEGWVLKSLDEVPHWVLEDGSKLERNTGADGFLGRLAGYYQIATSTPGNNIRITLPAA